MAALGSNHTANEGRIKSTCRRGSDSPTSDSRRKLGKGRFQHRPGAQQVLSKQMLMDWGTE